MEPGDTITIGPAEYHNAQSSVLRLNDAYEGERQWTIKTTGGRYRNRDKKRLSNPTSTITRTK